MSHPSYPRVLGLFVRNALVREMSFRGNFLIAVFTRAFWFFAQLVLFDLIYGQVDSISGWNQYEFLAFIATSMIINTLIEAIFMPNCAQFSELVRTGQLDFALLKPIDTQFLVSFEKLDIGALSHLALSGSLLGYALYHVQLEGGSISPINILMYLFFVLVAVGFFYSLMITLASLSVFFVRNQGLYDFWFYITIFARYPQDIYRGSIWADLLRLVFSYLIPVLLVVTVPAKTLLAKTLEPSWLALVSLTTTAIALVGSRWMFQWSLRNYRSASS